MSSLSSKLYIKEGGLGVPKSIADARPAKIVPGRNALRTISGRRAGKDHARTQGPLRGERAAWRRNADR